MSDEEAVQPPPAPEPPPPPPPTFDADAEAKALREFLAEQKKAEDAIRAEEDPELEAVEAACDATRIEQRT
jgi:hypothetical protein